MTRRRREVRRAIGSQEGVEARTDQEADVPGAMKLNRRDGLE